MGASDLVSSRICIWSCLDWDLALIHGESVNAAEVNLVMIFKIVE